MKGHQSIYLDFHIQQARSREKGAGEELLLDLARSLRKGPTRKVRLLVAEMLEKAAAAKTNADVARALYLLTGRNPRTSMQQRRIAFEMLMVLMDEREKNPKFTEAAARKRVVKNLAQEFPTLKAERVKKIWLRWRVPRGDRTYSIHLYPRKVG
jgi:hypothetical protein